MAAGQSRRTMGTAGRDADELSSGPRDVPFCDPVPEDLQCGICLGPAMESVVTEECGHLFCKECIFTAVEGKKECPMCRVQLTHEQVRKDVRSQRKIQTLAVFCKNKQGGCPWKGTLADFDRHIDKCEYAMVKCPFAPFGCDGAVTRKTLTEHVQANVTSHLLLICSAISKLQDEHLTLQQELDILQRWDQRFIWVIPNFGSKKGPVYSRKFTAKGHQWYLGVDFEGPDQHAGVYLFAEGHTKRVDFKLILFNQDPAKDKMHTVNDWTVDYKGKGWGPLKFIDRRNLAGTGFIVNGCVRIATEIEGEPFD
eukprot:TRINITY_DN530_c0_g1_i2.p2 TRINITY_DN530_c0_g1~~TRINITY_DN530_c0_g1_i2.p2  ORF type:complete len:337 (+),score=137.06 TRINITY_DN530_c0_g1_i2:83-1012(+)